MPHQNMALPNSDTAALRQHLAALASQAPPFALRAAVAVLNELVGSNSSELEVNELASVPQSMIQTHESIKADLAVAAKDKTRYTGDDTLAFAINQLGKA